MSEEKQVVSDVEWLRKVLEGRRPGLTTILVGGEPGGVQIAASLTLEMVRLGKRILLCPWATDYRVLMDTIVALHAGVEPCRYGDGVVIPPKKQLTEEELERMKKSVNFIWDGRIIMLDNLFVVGGPAFTAWARRALEAHLEDSPVDVLIVHGWALAPLQEPAAQPEGSIVIDVENERAVIRAAMAMSEEERGLLVNRLHCLDFQVEAHQSIWASWGGMKEYEREYLAEVLKPVDAAYLKELEAGAKVSPHLDFYVARVRWDATRVHLLKQMLPELQWGLGSQNAPRERVMELARKVVSVSRSMFWRGWQFPKHRRCSTPSCPDINAHLIIEAAMGGGKELRERLTRELSPEVFLVPEMATVWRCLMHMVKFGDYYSPEAMRRALEVLNLHLEDERVLARMEAASGPMAEEELKARVEKLKQDAAHGATCSSVDCWYKRV